MSFIGKFLLTLLFFFGIVFNANAESYRFKKYVFDGNGVYFSEQEKLSELFPGNPPEEYLGILPSENTPESEIDWGKVIFSSNSISLISSDVGVKSTNSFTITNKMTEPIFLVRMPEFFNDDIRIINKNACQAVMPGNYCNISIEYTPSRKERITHTLNIFGQPVMVVAEVNFPNEANEDNSSINIGDIPLKFFKDHGINSLAGAPIIFNITNTSDSLIKVPVFSLGSTSKASISGTCQTKLSLSPHESCFLNLSSSTDISGSIPLGIGQEMVTIHYQSDSTVFSPSQPGDIWLVTDLADTQRHTSYLFDLPAYRDMSSLRIFYLRNMTDRNIYLSGFNINNNFSRNLALGGGNCHDGHKMPPYSACAFFMSINGSLPLQEIYSIVGFSGEKTRITIKPYDPAKEKPDIRPTQTNNTNPLGILDFGRIYEGYNRGLEKTYLFRNFNSKAITVPAMNKASLQGKNFYISSTNCTGIYNEGIYSSCYLTIGFNPIGLSEGEYSGDVFFGGIRTAIKATIDNRIARPGDVKFEIDGGIRTGDGILTARIKDSYFGYKRIDNMMINIRNISDRTVDFSPLTFENALLGKGFSISSSTCYVEQRVAPSGSCQINLTFNNDKLPVMSSSAVFNYMNDQAQISVNTVDAVFDVSNALIVHPRTNTYNPYVPVTEIDFTPKSEGTVIAEVHQFPLHNMNGAIMLVPPMRTADETSPIKLIDLCKNRFLVSASEADDCIMKFEFNPMNLSAGEYTNTFSYPGGQVIKAKAVIYNTDVKKEDLKFVGISGTEDSSVKNLGDFLNSMPGDEVVTFHLKNITLHNLYPKISDFSLTSKLSLVSNDCIQLLNPGAICSITVAVHHGTDPGKFSQSITVPGTVASLDFNVIKPATFEEASMGFLDGLTKAISGSGTGVWGAGWEKTYWWHADFASWGNGPDCAIFRGVFDIPGTSSQEVTIDGSFDDYARYISIDGKNLSWTGVNSWNGVLTTERKLLLPGAHRLEVESCSSGGPIGFKLFVRNASKSNDLITDASFLYYTGVHRAP